MEEFDEHSLHGAPDLEETLKVLKNSGDDSSPTQLVYGLSGLAENDSKQVKPVWDGLKSGARLRLLRQFAQQAEANFELSYGVMGFIGLDDSEPSVREAAIDLLWEDQSLRFMDQLIKIAENDSAFSVRAAAAGALGRFILLGEFEELPGDATKRVQDVVAGLWSNYDEHPEVRRRALEALANGSHELVNQAILEAYESPDFNLRLSAVFAMGRTCDDRWEEFVLMELDSEDSPIRYEAVRAAGEIELHSAVAPLIQLAQQPEDREIKDMAIWALGEIGGSNALDTLDELALDAEEAEDYELLETIEDAIGNATLMSEDFLGLVDLDNEI